MNLLERLRGNSETPPQISQVTERSIANLYEEWNSIVIGSHVGEIDEQYQQWLKDQAIFHPTRITAHRRTIALAVFITGKIRSSLLDLIDDAPDKNTQQRLKEHGHILEDALNLNRWYSKNLGKAGISEREDYSVNLTLAMVGNDFQTSLGNEDASNLSRSLKGLLFIKNKDLLVS